VLVQAAVRETFEECGVLLAGPRSSKSGGLAAGAVATARADLVARRCTLGQLLAGADLLLRADLLRPWARWITPEGQPRRYDTAFFVALLPTGQQADAHTTEAVEATWWHPEAALEQWERGELQLMAPTIWNLRELAAQPDSAAVLAAAERRDVHPVTPRVIRRDGRRVVVLPGEPDVEFAGGGPP
jgi:8-oxo-dGTP pyrophosphatase MutT (NUDIX family)